VGRFQFISLGILPGVGGDGLVLAIHEALLYQRHFSGKPFNNKICSMKLTLWVTIITEHSSISSIMYRINYFKLLILLPDSSLSPHLGILLVLKRNRLE
jgi:hypothetical protein